jgi:SAM-dependent methyltransferase
LIFFKDNGIVFSLIGNTMEKTKDKLKIGRERVYSYSDGTRFQNKKMERVFTEIYHDKYWHQSVDSESISGPGSSEDQTATIREELSWILKEFKIKSVLDIPCGDFNWMKRMDWSTIKYVGADIVKDLVRENKKRYSNRNISFLHLDLTKDSLPKNDLIICRDCLVHFSFKDIQKAMQNMIESGITYLLTTTFVEQPENHDTVTGGWRPLNLEKEPFSFPPPLRLINENCMEKNGVFKDKSLALFELDGFESRG